MTTLQDDQAIALAQEFPASDETSVTALLQEYRRVNNLTDWSAYVTFCHNVAAFAGTPRSNFVDAQAAAWASLTAP